jgi:hypothetical protein
LISKKFEKEIVFESSVLAWTRIRIEQKCWIRIRIKSIRIHNPGSNISTLVCREVEELRSELEATGRSGMARGRSLLPNIGLNTPPNKKKQAAKKRVTIAVERYKVIE